MLYNFSAVAAAAGALNLGRHRLGVSVQLNVNSATAPTVTHPIGNIVRAFVATFESEVAPTGPMQGVSNVSAGKVTMDVGDTVQQCIAAAIESHTPSGVRRSLERAALLLQSREFLREHYTMWCAFLLERVVPDWALCFEEKERKRLVNVFFTNERIPACAAFSALAQGLGEVTKGYGLTFVLRNLSAFVHEVKRGEKIGVSGF